MNKAKDKSIIHNIFIIQDDHFIISGFYCIAFIDYMITRKKLLDHTNLYFPNEYENNDKIIDRYFKGKYDKPLILD